MKKLTPLSLRFGKALGVLSALGFFFAMSTQVFAQESAPDSGESWKLVWSDEFDQTDIDSAKWNRDIDCWGGGNEERQCYTQFPENAYLKDGNLVITARIEKSTGPALPPRLQKTKEDKKKTATKGFTSARLTTKNKGDWRYGRVEVRAKMPEGQGTWPAIWMLPTDEIYGDWALSGEIDIMEAINLGAKCEKCPNEAENHVFGTLHYGRKWPKNSYKSEYIELPPSKDGFHTYAIEWSEGEIAFFLNDELYQTQTSKKWYTKGKGRKGKKHAPFDQRFHLILNLAIGGKLPEMFNQKGVSIKGFPKQMLVDYVRVYECADNPTTGISCRD